MRNSLVLTAALLLVTGLAVQSQNLIPYPQHLVSGEGKFILTRHASIHAPRRFQKEAIVLEEMLARAIGVDGEGGGPSFDLSDDSTIATPEGYHLEITERHAVIKARDGAGIIHAIETIRQLLPAETEHGHVEEAGASAKAGMPAIALPALSIDDYPRYSWRGMHLDVSRHFFSIDYLYRFVDRMALYKMNKLHLHLTDDQGWRVEIKKYPLLTQVGAWRTFNNQDSVCMIKSADNPDFAIDSSHIITKNGHQVYGGFYTQQQLRDLVAYAAARHIDIIPEIDMPGHMMAAINNYPFLTCNGENKWGELNRSGFTTCTETKFTSFMSVFECAP